MAAKFVGNFFSGKWDSIIATLEVQDGEPRTFNQQFFENADGRFDENIKMLKSAGYDKVDSVEWINYYPVKHFDPRCVSEFEKFVDMKCARAWISKIRPGKYAPIHQDIDDNIETYQEQGELFRFSTFISHPHPGGVFVFEDQCFHCEASGNTYQWNHYMDWHAGGNCGLHDKYMFHFLGIK
jgi:hypothetical protein